MQTLPLTPTLLATPHRFLLHTPTNTAILSDLHLGIEHTMRQQGLAFPNINEQKIRESWRHLLTTLQSRARENNSNSEAQSKKHRETHIDPQTDPHTSAIEPGRGAIIIAGDLFDTPTPDPASLSLAHELFTSLPKNISLTLLPGNHDPDLATLRALFPDPRITITDSITLAENLVFHGHQWPTNARTNRPISPPNRTETAPKAPQNQLSHPQRKQKGAPLLTAIVGHQHPAILLRSRLQSAKMICFATCQLTTSNSELNTLILLPTFSRAPLGTNLLTHAANNRWIIDRPAPSPANIRIAGIIEGPDNSSVLDFGPLAAL